MVSQQALLPSSRDRLVAAAAAEFAALGFDGAKVDRIARRARVNKAMLYYHFRSKADLYRAILRELFQSLAAAVADVRRAGGSPPDQLGRYVRVVAEAASTTPHFPAMWLREIAEGGRHLDAAVIGDVASILGVLAAILRDGKASGHFGDAHPFTVQMGIVAPLLLFSASAALRDKFAALFPARMAAATREDMIAHVEHCTLAALRLSAAPSASRSRRHG